MIVKQIKASISYTYLKKNNAATFKLPVRRALAKAVCPLIIDRLPRMIRKQFWAHFNDQKCQSYIIL